VKFLLTFHDVYSSLECRSVFRRAGVPCTIDSVPPELGLSCGYAVSGEAPDARALDALLAEHSLAYAKMIALE
jgi:hypothetical protein